MSRFKMSRSIPSKILRVRIHFLRFHEQNNKRLRKYKLKCINLKSLNCVCFKNKKNRTTCIKISHSGKMTPLKKLL